MKLSVSFSSLRVKAMVAMSGLIILTSAVLGGFLFNHMRVQMKRELLKRGEATVRQTANSCEYGVLTENSVELIEILEGLTLQDDFVYATVQDTVGDILAQHDAMDAEELVSWFAKKDFDSVSRGDTTAICYWTIPEQNIDIIDLAFPVRTKSFEISLEDLGVTTVDDNQEASLEKIGIVRIGLSLEQMYDRIYDAAKMTGVIIMLVALAVILLTTLAVNLIIKPVDKLIGATEQIARGDLSQLVDEGSVDEIGRLARAFNAMVKSLRESRDEIELYNRTLELKIADRTRELEEAQTQLVQSEKMSAIGQLAAGVAHELNNPMGGILGYAQFALEKLTKVSPENLTEGDLRSQTKYLRDIEQQARRCRAIVKNLLRFSRSSNITKWEDFDLNATLDDTISLIQHQLDLGNIEINRQFADDLPKLHGNASQLQQVFTNLMLNAQHAMPDGGLLTITTRFSPKLGEFSGCVEVIVQDTGIGIEEEHLGKIFEPFYTTKETGKGTGLGLSISYGIVKEHGGDITVSSEPGEGTRFSVIIPLDSTASGTVGHEGVTKTEHSQKGIT
jgi:signal transduction histidine kinase